MSKLVSTFLVTIAFSAVALADDTYQVHYFANVTQGGSVANMTNNGASNGTICANVFVFDAGSAMYAPEIISCCACPIVVNGAVHLNGATDMIGNTLTAGIPLTGITVAVVASPDTGMCNPSSITALAHGLVAWGTTLHNLPTPPGGVALTESEFVDSTLTATELTHLTSTCAFIQADGSGSGLCGACRPGVAGATKQ